LLVGVALLDLMLVSSFLRQYRRHGNFGISVLRPRNIGQAVQDGLSIVGFALLTWQAGVVAASTRLTGLIVKDDMLLALGRVIGGFLLIGGVLLCVLAQRHLGASWRIGVDPARQAPLVTSRIYRFSRNPIFLALLVAFAGYALMLPTYTSLALFLGAVISVRRQIAVEEQYLLATYGASYREYAQAVGRFVPFMGKLPAAETSR
jgi:protein-S-isoprenylcysteine O-methyltransferase Ste14